MKTEIAKLWCDALRSGKYKQAKGQLQTVSGFCCLGVLADLGRKRGIHVRTYESGRLLGGSLVKAVVNADYYYTEIREWSGLKTGVGEIIGGVVIPSTDGEKCRYSLADINDQGDLTFTQIAGIIEKYAEEL